MPIGSSEFMQLVHGGQLESGASAGADDATLVSVAISLKRIADVLERWDHRGAMLTQKRGS